MKKIIAAIMSVTVIASIAATAFAVGELSRVSVTASESSKIVSDTYPSGLSGTTDEVKINDLMSDLLKNLTATKDVAQDIKITSISANSQPVSFWLKLELPETVGAARSGATAVDYYSVRITDSANRVIYDDEAEDSKTGLTEKTISLGILNENNKGTVTNTYKMYVSANNAVNVSSLSDKPEDVVWKLVYTDDKSMFEPDPTPYVSITAAPATSAPTPVQSQITAFSSPAPSSTPSTVPSSAPTGTATPTATPPTKTITIKTTSDTSSGDAIKPGTYKLIGSGHAVITDKNGNKKAEFDLSTKVDSQPTTTLNTGDIVTVTGDVNAYVQFKAPSTTATPTAKAASKATATPKATAKTTAKPTATAKVNPATGDNTPIVFVSVIALLALAAVVYIGLTSKKKTGK